MNRKIDSKEKQKPEDVKVFNIIPDEIRARLEILDLENEDTQETESVEVFNIVSDDVRSRLEVLDPDDE